MDRLSSRSKYYLIMTIHWDNSYFLWQRPQVSLIFCQAYSAFSCEIRVQTGFFFMFLKKNARFEMYIFGGRCEHGTLTLAQTVA